MGCVPSNQWGQTPRDQWGSMGSDSIDLQNPRLYWGQVVLINESMESDPEISPQNIQ